MIGCIAINVLNLFVLCHLRLILAEPVLDNHGACRNRLEETPMAVREFLTISLIPELQNHSVAYSGDDGYFEEEHEENLEKERFNRFASVLIKDAS